MKISIGSRVRVEWENLSPIEGTVTHIPAATGDSWEIVSRCLNYAAGSPLAPAYSEYVHYVQTFSRMTILA